MRLPDFVNNIRRTISEVSNFLRHPEQVIGQKIKRTAQDKYENTELPWQSSSSPEKEPENNNNEDRISKNTNLNSINQTYPTTKSVEIIQEQKGLPEVKELAGGRRGRYKIGALIKVSEESRLYNATQILNEKEVIITEYLLPEDLNSYEVQECKDSFEDLASLNLKTEQGQDFRIITPWDIVIPARAEERSCYLINEAELSNNLLTLEDYLDLKTTMSVTQVIRFLEQVLQSLQYLHSHRVRLTNDEIKIGLAHGNLNETSLLIDVNEKQSLLNEESFFVYLSNLSLWGNPAKIFPRNNSSLLNENIIQDLVDLGYISLYLLSGDLKYLQEKRDNLELNQHWSFLEKHPQLQQFISKLIGLELKFESAEVALINLIKIKNAPPEPQEKEEIKEAEKATQIEKKSSCSTFLFIFIFFVVIGGFLGFILKSLSGRNNNLEQGFNLLPSQHPCCLNQVKDLPFEKATYIIDNQGIWNDVLREKSGLVATGNYAEQGESANTLKDELIRRYPALSKYQLDISTEDVIKKVENTSVYFGLTHIVSDDDLPDELKQKVVAYHGLVVVVAFNEGKKNKSFWTNFQPNSSDDRSATSIPELLEGRISIEQLQELYTTEVTSARIKEFFPNLGIFSTIKLKLYAPNNQSTIDLFETLLFRDNNNAYLELIDKIHSQDDSGKQKNMLQAILKDFEESDFEDSTNEQLTLAIGFDSLANVFGQCSVYPLAVGKKNQEVQPLQQTNGQPINPKTDLCNDKRSYWPSVKNFAEKKYLLSYPLVVVYREDDEKSRKAGEKFADLLLTDEGQHLLRESGLVPVRNLE